jgi:hypothetical protein
MQMTFKKPILLTVLCFILLFSFHETLSAAAVQLGTGAPYGNYAGFGIYSGGLTGNTQSRRSVELSDGTIFVFHLTMASLPWGATMGGYSMSTDNGNSFGAQTVLSWPQGYRNVTKDMFDNIYVTNSRSDDGRYVGLWKYMYDSSTHALSVLPEI